MSHPFNVRRDIDGPIRCEKNIAGVLSAFILYIPDLKLGSHSARSGVFMLRSVASKES
jgi:hypothetical protein